MPLLALTREISPGLADGERTHVDRLPIDIDRARAEHEAYEAALRALGCEVRRLPAGPALPDSVFIEDTAVVLDELAIVCRPGARSRWAETAAVSQAVRAHRPVAAIIAPGTLDGGDVLRVGRRLYVGVGCRTNRAGFTQLRALVGSHGYEAVAVSFDGCLHLKTAATLVADDLLLANPAWLDVSQLQPLRIVAVDPSEPFAANALRIGDAVIHPAELSRTGERLARAGVRVHPVPAGELAKAEGGVTCCSLVFRTAAAPGQGGR